MLVLNAISLNMVPAAFAEGRLEIRRLTTDEARTWAGYAAADRDIQSAVGHADTAAVFSDVLGITVPCARTTVVLDSRKALVGQYVGPRLPEGATSLPPGARIDWFSVALIPGEIQDATEIGLKAVADYRAAQKAADVRATDELIAARREIDRLRLLVENIDKDRSPGGDEDRRH